MTLAATILLVGISLASVDPSFVTQSAPQSSSSATEQSPSGQSDSNAVKPSSMQSSGTKRSSEKTEATAARKNSRRKKASPKVAPTEACDPPPPSVSPAGSPSSGRSPETGNGLGPPSPGSETPKNCPPPKIVVRQGGVSEQSIQLAGGSPRGESTQKRESTHQMLATTEENLKKVAGIQLAVDQQNSVSQIRQFVSQSKSALAAADFERAQTLAWKAKVLSEDLVKPKK